MVLNRYIERGRNTLLRSLLSEFISRTANARTSSRDQRERDSNRGAVVAASRCESLRFMKARYRRSNLAHQLAERPGCLIASFPPLTARQVRNVKSGFRSLIFADEGAEGRAMRKQDVWDMASRGARSRTVCKRCHRRGRDLLEETIISSRTSGEMALVPEKWRAILAERPSTLQYMRF